MKATDVSCQKKRSEMYPRRMIYLQNGQKSNRELRKQDQRKNGNENQKFFKWESCNQVGLAGLFLLPAAAGPLLRLPSALSPAVFPPGVVAVVSLPSVPCSAGVGIPGSRPMFLSSLCVCVAGAASIGILGTAGDWVPGS